MDKIFIEQTLEIRFKPNPKVLDKRGEITAALGDAFLNKWTITGNSVELKNEDFDQVKAFFGFRNMGFSGNYPLSKDDFLKHSRDFLKRGWHLIPLGEVERIGISSKIVFKTNNFNEYLKAFRKKFLALTDDELSQFGGTLVDLSFPLNFSDGLNQFNIVLGPVQKKEIEAFFKSFEKETPVYGLIANVDYFTTEIPPLLKQKDVITLIEEGVKKAEDVLDTLVNLLK